MGEARCLEGMIGKVITIFKETGKIITIVPSILEHWLRLEIGHGILFAEFTYSKDDFPESSTNKVSFAILWATGEYTSEAKEQKQLRRDLGIPARDVVLIIKSQYHLAGPDPKISNRTPRTAHKARLPEELQALTAKAISEDTDVNVDVLCKLMLACSKMCRVVRPMGAMKAAMSVVKDFAITMLNKPHVSNQSALMPRTGHPGARFLS
ncbi:hypothetical protein FPANT_4002 [Fusarium pseudoanthophilum]|uniref:Uncharacterized protein n=1 Tax=Fusarium pseudoanthophilum TaxID=48495 RepID=A0A8H5UUE7_9HYPO|nr:hypothetical protein FPANT_4002 [Fusarium pseudoanthophilum]